MKTKQVRGEIAALLANLQARLTTYDDVLRMEGMDEEGVGNGFISAEKLQAKRDATADLLGEMQERFGVPADADEAEAEAEAAPANDTAPGAVPEGSTPGRRSSAWTQERREAQAERMRERRRAAA